MSTPDLSERPESLQRVCSAPVPVNDLAAALRCATIPIWLLVCVVGTWVWGGYVTLGLVFLSWKAAARFG